MKERYDKTANDKTFQTGDLVWVHFPEVMVGGSRKFFLNWSGPYIITERTSDTNYRVAHAHNSEPLKNEIHLNRIKHFYHRSVLPPKPDDPTTVTTTDDITDLNPNDRIALVPPAVPNDVAAKKTTPPSQEKPTLTPPLPAASQELTHETDEDRPISAEILRLLSKPTADNQDDHSNATPVPRRDSNLPPATKEKEETENIYEINKIMKGRYKRDGTIEYLIDWKNYPPCDRTYEPYEHLNESAREYVDKHKIPITGKKPKA